MRDRFAAAVIDLSSVALVALNGGLNNQNSTHNRLTKAAQRELFMGLVPLNFVAVTGLA